MMAPGAINVPSVAILFEFFGPASLRTGSADAVPLGKGAFWIFRADSWRLRSGCIDRAEMLRTVNIRTTGCSGCGWELTAGTRAVVFSMVAVAQVNGKQMCAQGLGGRGKLVTWGVLF